MLLRCVHGGVHELMGGMAWCQESARCQNGMLYAQASCSWWALGRYPLRQLWSELRTFTRNKS
jgi:hypothetical protein